MIRRGIQLVPKFFAPFSLTRLGVRPISFVSQSRYPSYHLLTMKPKSFFAGTSAMNAATTVNLPNLADSITEGRVQELKKQAGDSVEVDETVAVIETDKVSVEIKAPKAGVITKFYAKVGEDLAVGKPFFDIDADAKAAPKKEAKDEKKEEKAPKKEVKEEKKEEKPVQKAEKVEDKQPKSAPSGGDKKKEAPAPKPQKPSIFGSSGAAFERKTTNEPLSKLRLKVGQRLKESQNTYALLTTFQEVDCGEVMEIRKAHQEEFVNKYGIKLGFMSFFVKATVAAIQEHPIVNAVIDGTNMVQRNYIDISVAVATPTGLMVPVLRNCQHMKFHEVELQLAEYAKKGKAGKLTLEDINGGTFTISNGGTFGSLMGTPIINPPQSAILGMHSIINRPVVRGDQIVARPMMYLALTYDHRLLDGKDAVLFLKKIQNCVEDPKRILLEI